MMNLTIEIEKQIRQQGEKIYPSECCGIIFGSINRQESKTVSAIEPIRNSKEESEQYHRFLITADEMLLAEQKARKLKVEILGFYHSHPDCEAVPSEYDKNYALPFYSYIILSVQEGIAKELNSWELAIDRSQFNAEIINII